MSFPNHNKYAHSVPVLRRRFPIGSAGVFGRVHGTASCFYVFQSTLSFVTISIRSQPIFLFDMGRPGRPGYQLDEASRCLETFHNAKRLAVPEGPHRPMGPSFLHFYHLNPERLNLDHFSVFKELCCFSDCLLLLCILYFTVFHLQFLKLLRRFLSEGIWSPFFYQCHEQFQEL